ncbi:MAG: hypothetical protein BWZ02_01220 [Lentisphaerae bacterium ADurb.BinA184]|nr:MAG: hypothetical protein BWZ02_01220 [Lentisphaerae bacterium ADurb.BinA184]
MPTHQDLANLVWQTADLKHAEEENMRLLREVTA